MLKWKVLHPGPLSPLGGGPLAAGSPWSRVMVFSSWICSSSSASLRVFMVALGTPAHPVLGLLSRATLEIVPGIWALCDGGQGS